MCFTAPDTRTGCGHPGTIENQFGTALGAKPAACPALKVIPLSAYVLDPVESDDPRSALAQREFTRVLERACARGWLDQHTSREATRRLEADQLQDIDLRALLFQAPRTEEWAALRQGVIALLVDKPERSASVLSIERHISRLPELEREIEARGPENASWYLAQAAQRVGDHRHVSAVQRANSKKCARHLAITSLVARMAALPDPFDEHAEPSSVIDSDRIRGPATAPVKTTVLAAPDGQELDGLERAEFSERLRGSGAQPPTELIEQAVQRARCGVLDARDVLWLLFQATGDHWDPARRDALECTAARAGMAAQTLDLYDTGTAGALKRVEPSPVGGHPVGYAAVAEMVTADGPRTGRFVATSKEAARHGAAVLLLAELAGLEPPAFTVTHPTRSKTAAFDLSGMALLHAVPNRPPAMTLHTAYQRGMFTKPEYAVSGGGGAQLSCRGSLALGQQRIEVLGHGPSSPVAKHAAAALLLIRVNRLLEGGASAAVDRNPAPLPPPGSPVGHVPAQSTAQRELSLPLPRARRAEVEDDRRDASTIPPPVNAGSELEQVLERGYAVAFETGDISTGSGFLLYGPAGSGLTPAAEYGTPVDRMVNLPDSASSAAKQARTACAVMPLLPCALALIGAAPHRLHPSARAWAQVVRLALHMIADRGVYPALAPDGIAHWRLTPVPTRHATAFADAAQQVAAHPLAAPAPGVRGGANATMCVHAFLDAFATAFTVPPGAPVLLGEAPFLGRHRPVGHLQPWADQLSAHADPTPAPAMVIQIDPPTDTRTPTLRATLLLRLDPDTEPVEACKVWNERNSAGASQVDTARRVGRALRKAGAIYPPLHRLAALSWPERLLLSPHDAADLLGPVAKRLAEDGIEVSWSGEWTGVLDLETVVTRARPQDDETIGLESLLYMEWQAVVDGQPLTAREMDALAEAHRPLVRVRDRWLLLDPETTRRLGSRQITQLPVAEVLLDLLHGQVTIDGHGYACSPVAGLSEMIALLRGGERDTDLTPVPTGLARPLFPHQHRGLDWLARTTQVGLGACLADDMGLGKTLTAIALHLHHAHVKRARTLVICPGSLVINWVREFAQHAPNTEVRIYHGPERDPADLAAAGVVITSYTTMALDLADLSADAWDLVIADEAQLMKNPDTRNARSARALRAGARVALTGTPVENQLGDLWSILNWANPGLFGTRQQFRRSYARPIEKPRDQAEHDQARERLHAVTRPFLLRRLKSDPAIALNLPAKHERERIVAVSRTQAGLYEAVRREALAALEHDNATAGMTVLRLLHDLRMICNAPAHYHREPPEALLIDLSENEAQAPKLEAVREIVEDACNRGSATLIYTSYARMGRLIQAHLTAAGYPETRFMHGEATPTERQPMVDALQTGQIPVLVLTRRVGGIGLNLTRATEVVHYDPDWNPASEAQANDRAYRLGQTRDVTVHRLITEGSVEEKIASRAEWKRRLAEGAVPANTLSLDHLDAREIADLFELGDH